MTIEDVTPRALGDCLQVVGVRKHVQGLKAGNLITQPSEPGQVPGEGRRFAGHIEYF